MAMPKVGSLRYFSLISRERLASQRGSFKFYDGEEDEYREKPSCFRRLKKAIAYSWEGLYKFVIDAWEFGHKDRRNVIFSAKVALALVIVSLLIFFKVPFKDLSKYAVWAIFTVIFVFEFTIGATFNKGFNRGLGTFSAGGLAIIIAELSVMAGKYEETIIIISIFLAGLSKICMQTHTDIIFPLIPLDGFIFPVISVALDGMCLSCHYLAIR